MWDALPDELRVLVALTGMALLALFVASMITRYERYQAEKRLIVQRLSRGIGTLERAFSMINTSGLPQGLGRALRKEILARYISIKRVISSHPGINESIQKAGRLLEQEPDGAATPTPPSFPDRDSLDAYLRGTSAFLEIVRSNDLCGALSRDQRVQYLEFLQLLQAEAAFAYFTESAAKKAASDTYNEAITEMRMLDTYLHGINLVSDRLMTLRRQAKQKFVDYYTQQNEARLSYQLNAEAAAHAAARREG